MSVALSVGEVRGSERYSSGNIVVVSWSEVLEAPAILEYRPGGTVVREVQIFGPPGEENWSPRDLVVDQAGRIHVELGIDRSDGNRTLATLHPTGAWTFSRMRNWSNQGVVYYGAIGINKDYLYAGDQSFGGDETEGIVRYPLDDLDSPRHFPGPAHHAVKVGLNGLVYGIDRDGNASWYHPDSMERLGFLPPGKLHRRDSVISFAVDANGHFYTVDLGDDVNHFDEDGNFLEEVDLQSTALGDIEISSNGDLIVSLANKAIRLYDRNLNGGCEFPIPAGPSIWDRSFLAFAEHICVPRLRTEAPEIAGLNAVGDDFQISFRSQVGNRYSLQRSPDLDDWTTIQVGLAGNGEIRRFLDPNALKRDASYYRVLCEFVSPP